MREQLAQLLDTAEARVAESPTAAHRAVADKLRAALWTEEIRLGVRPDPTLRSITPEQKRKLADFRAMAAKRKGSATVPVAAAGVAPAAPNAQLSTPPLSTSAE